MRILLVRPPQPAESHGLKHLMVCEPLELEYVAAGIPEHEVRIHDMLVSKRGLVEVLTDFCPDIVGTSCYINNVWDALRVCRIAKQVAPQTRTVLGGVHATVSPHEFEYDDVDFIVQGEGLTTFREFTQCLMRGTDPAIVPGIAFRQNGSFHYTPARPFPEDVDAFPFPARALTEHHRNDYFYLTWRPLTLMKTSWGCPYNCTFCYTRLLAENKYFTRSPESIVAELEQIPSKQVFIIDDAFLFGRRKLENLHGLIKERGINKEFLVYGRTDFIAENPDLMEKWADIGLSMVRVGLEGVTDEELAQYNKRNTIENNDKAIDICRSLGIDVSASIILPPHYTRKDFRAVNAYIKRRGLVYLILNPLAPLPGTELHETYANEIIAPHTSSYPLWDFQHCVIKPTGMSLRSFYRSMHFLYLSAIHPIRAGKLTKRRRPPFLSVQGLRLWWGLVRTYAEMLCAFRHHKRFANRDQVPTDPGP